MILADPRGRATTTRIGGRITLDELLRRAALRRPDALAVLDPPNREAVVGGKPRSLTYKQAEHVVSAIAGRLRRMGLHTDGIVALQMANTVESLLTLLGVLRAGLIAMPLPALWRRSEMVAALSRVSPTALIVSGRMGTTDHYALAMQVAAEIFPIRYVCGYSAGAPDGLVPFDNLFEMGKLDPIPAWAEERAGEPGPTGHLAVITWDVGADGLVPVARSHAELIAGGLAVILESGLQQDCVLLSTLMSSSFAGLATGMIPWLLTGGTLALHHPFDAHTYANQLARIGCNAVVIPGQLSLQLSQCAASLPERPTPDVIAVWRAPERLHRASLWREKQGQITDILIFGETALLAARRGGGGKPAVIPFGVVSAPRAAKASIVAAEIAATPAGTVAIRGPMVPRAPFPPGAERSSFPHLRVAPTGFVDTGYASDPGLSAMVVTGSPPGMASVGGYRFLLSELQEILAGAPCGPATLTVLPDALTGHRLSASASDREGVEAEMANLDTNPLVSGAFRERATRHPANT
jgi:hypothetical protein